LLTWRKEDRAPVSGGLFSEYPCAPDRIISPKRHVFCFDLPKTRDPTPEVTSMTDALAYLQASRDSDIASLQRLLHTGQLIAALSELIHQLQRERGASNIWICSQGRLFARERLAREQDVSAATQRVAQALPPAVAHPGDSRFCNLIAAALQALAAHVVAQVRARGTLRVLAVTGSQGKTSTKDLLAAVLRAAGPTVATAGSRNNELGTPLTALQVEEDTAHLLLEMGARGIGHIADLARLFPPDAGVVLNVGTAHVGEFGSRDAPRASR